MTIVPPRFLDEIKALPEHILSFQKQVTARFLGKYTGLGVNDTLVHSVKVDLTKNIPRIMGELQDEVGYSIGKHIGPCEDWTGYELYNMLLHLVALLSGRIFVGHPLSRNETWLHATVRYTIDGFVGAEKLWTYPRILHPIMQYLIPEASSPHPLFPYPLTLCRSDRCTAIFRMAQSKSNPRSKHGDIHLPKHSGCSLRSSMPVKIHPSMPKTSHQT